MRTSLSPMVVLAGGSPSVLLHVWSDALSLATTLAEQLPQARVSVSLFARALIPLGIGRSCCTRHQDYSVTLQNAVQLRTPAYLYSSSEPPFANVLPGSRRGAGHLFYRNAHHNPAFAKSPNYAYSVDPKRTQQPRTSNPKTLQTRPATLRSDNLFCSPPTRAVTAEMRCIQLLSGKCCTSTTLGPPVWNLIGAV